MKILFNPYDGAQIENVFYKDVLYFDTRENAQFKVGGLLSFDDEVADFFMGLYGFLQEIDQKEAERVLKQSKNPLKCEKCDFTTHTDIALIGHSRKHQDEKSIEELGIPRVKGPKAIKNERSIEEDIEAQTRREGLVGEGLVDETPKKAAIM